MNAEINESAAPTKESLIRVRMLVAYDGSAFHGFAHQKGGIRTVAGALREAIAGLLGFEPDITCAGRTDTGVHAWGQVIHFDVPRHLYGRADAQRMQVVLNRRLAPQIVIREASSVEDGFHARFSASARRYRYTILNTPLPDPFRAHTSWWIPDPLDVDAMNRASDALIGEHDFSSFCRRPDELASLTRRINHVLWQRLDDTVRMDIEATAFCHQMVRSLTGMFVAIGRRRRSEAAMGEILKQRDRTGAATPAPPEGLCLWEVLY